MMWRWSHSSLAVSDRRVTTHVLADLSARGFGFLAATWVFALVGCEDGSPNAETPRSVVVEEDSSLDAEQRQLLESLGYVAGSEARRGEGSGVTRRTNGSCPGYNLYCIQELRRAELIDREGTLVHCWQQTTPGKWWNVELLANGDLMVIGGDAEGSPTEVVERVADEDRFVQRLAWDGSVRWKQRLLAHHDIELTPAGNLLTLGFERRPAPEISTSVATRDDRLLTLDGEGNLIGARSVLEAVRKSPDVFPLRQVEPSSFGNGGEKGIDLFHANSVEWVRHSELAEKHDLYDANHILVCFRNQDRIAVFDWSTNEVVWAWGLGKVFGPHDAQVLPSGNILLFDNGLGRRPAFSRAIELDPLERKIVWKYKADPPEDFFTASRGSVQRLPNGNTLLAESDNGRAFEIKPNGRVVWEFLCPHFLADGRRAAIVRMKRFELDFIDGLLAKDGAGK